jgi:heme/copper-type cytochrome/quinol oxidase subunit 1
MYFNVSGVVLANASLDIAFHDTVLMVLFGIIISSLLIMATTISYIDSFSIKSDHNSTDLLDKNNYNEYIKMF